jgi:PAS domain S-box-containing protein
LFSEKVDELTREIGRRMAVEASLRESKEWLRVVLISMGDAVIATDDSGRVSFMNPVAETLTGWLEAEARGRPLGDVFVIVNERTGAPAENPVDKVLREGCTIGLANHTLLISKGGARIPIDDSAAPIRSAAGRIDGVVLIFHTITERKEAERERERLLKREHAARLAAEQARLVAEQARAEAEEANRAKDEFLSTLSHELRTPLTAILGWSHILRTTAPDPARIARGIAIIERNARSQVRLVEDILDVSRIVTGKLRLNPRAVDLRSVVRAALDVVRPSLEAKGTRLEVSIDPAALPIYGDPDRLQQIAWNLLSNAAKFTPKEGRIALTLARAGPSIVLRVADTGEGIVADFLPHVFERFRQADASATRAHGGLGLGLAIVKHLVDLHGGAITAESEGPGRGATFTVTLPAAAVELPSDDRASGEIEGALGAPALLDGLRVIVVDHQPDARDIVARALRDRGATAIAAGSLADAFEALEGGAADVLVIDIGAPDEGGGGLLESARTLLAGHDRPVPALALTASGGPEEARRAYQAGFQAHLPKPVAPDQLADVVARLAERRRA